MAEKTHQLLELLGRHMNVKGTVIGDQFMRLRMESARLGGDHRACPFGAQIPALMWRGTWACMTRQPLLLPGMEADDEDRRSVL